MEECVTIFDTFSNSVAKSNTFFTDKLFNMVEELHYNQIISTF